MTRRRTVAEQVKSGFRIGGLLVLSFLVFVALEGSLTYMTGQAGSAKGSYRVIGAISSVALIAVLYLTTAYWAKWLLGILGYCFFRMLVPLGLATFGYTFRNVSTAQLGAWSLYALIGLALTVRYAKRKPRGAEKLGLVSFVVCVSLAMVYSSSIPLFYGLALLAAMELAERLFGSLISTHARRN